MPHEIGTLSLLAISTGFLHTLMGPDHYLPFVAMSRAGRWSLAKTSIITLLCGVAHVLSSVALGAVGIALGMAAFRLTPIEAARGEIAGWLLLGFGLAYLGWGVSRAIRNRPHGHSHLGSDAAEHAQGGAGQGGAGAGEAAETGSRGNMTPWVLFTIFLFGPCEPLIPVLMYPALSGDAAGVAWVTTLFALTTVSTMMGVVVLMYLGIDSIRVARVERYSHALAGLVVVACGMAIKLGL